LKGPSPVGSDVCASLNILSQSEGRSTEHMRRLAFPKTCEELIDLHKFGSDSETEAALYTQPISFKTGVIMHVSIGSTRI
jgi:hypothetical protein